MSQLHYFMLPTQHVNYVSSTWTTLVLVWVTNMILNIILYSYNSVCQVQATKMHMISLVTYVQILSFVHVYFYQTYNCVDKCLIYTTTINVSSGIFGTCCGSKQVKNSNTVSTDSDICSILSFLQSSILFITQILWILSVCVSISFTALFRARITIACSNQIFLRVFVFTLSNNAIKSSPVTGIHTFVSSHFPQIQYIGTKQKQLNKKWKWKMSQMLSQLTR